MGGASWNHGLINGNLAASLRERLKGKGISVQTNDLRVQIAATGLFAYPDLVVVCGQPDLPTRLSIWGCRSRFARFTKDCRLAAKSGRDARAPS